MSLDAPVRALERAELQKHGEWIGREMRWGRSRRLRAIFEALLSASLRDEEMTEEQLRTLVFAQQPEGSARSRNESIRAHIYRLRRRLLEFYRLGGREADLHIVIPKAGYRLVLLPAEGRPKENEKSRADPSWGPW